MVLVPDEQLAVGWISFVMFVGLLPGMINGRSRSGYAELEQPSFAPPPWLFGIVWPVLYGLMGAAAYLVQINGGFFVAGVNRTPLWLFLALQAVLAAWSFVFDGKRGLGLSLLVVTAGFVLSIVVSVLFGDTELAVYLMLPTVLWLGFASLLAYYLYKLNKPRCKKPKKSKKRDKDAEAV